MCCKTVACFAILLGWLGLVRWEPDGIFGMDPVGELDRRGTRAAFQFPSSIREQCDCSMLGMYSLRLVKATYAYIRRQRNSSPSTTHCSTTPPDFGMARDGLRSNWLISFGSYCSECRPHRRASRFPSMAAGGYPPNKMRSPH